MMDPNHSAQDVARCDLCKVAIVQSYCDICNINLCRLCIGEHISDDYNKHAIVPFQQRRSTLIYPKCEIHPKKVCKYQCRECNIFVCSHCVASKQHNKEHEFLNLEEVFRIKKEHIQKDMDDIEKQILPIYAEIVRDIENQISNLDGEYDKIQTEMTKQREKLHRDVDNAMNQMKIEISRRKVKHHRILKKHLDEMHGLQNHIQDILIHLNDLEDSNIVLPTIHYNSTKTRALFTLPQKVCVSMPQFIPKQIERNELCSFIGRITPISTTLEERVFTAKTPTPSVRELLDEPEVLSTIYTGIERLSSVSCLNEDQIWTSRENASDMKCFNNQGVLNEEIKTKSGESPHDIAVDNDGALLYSDWMTRAVYKVRNDLMEEIIMLQGWIPFNLCVTSSGDLLVTMYSDDETQSKVVRYSGSTVKQTIQFDDEGQNLFSGNSGFKFISENRNLDICMADHGACAVVVVNQAGKLRFRYTGYPSPTRDKPFEPYGITTDAQSCILTTDCNTHFIHILDSNGQFIRYIDNCYLEYPGGLCVDSNDILYVCEYESQSVKKIRYRK